MCGLNYFRYACGHVWKRVVDHCTLTSASLPLREVTEKTCEPQYYRDDWGALLKGPCGRKDCEQRFQMGWWYDDVVYDPRQRPKLPKWRPEFQTGLGKLRAMEKAGKCVQTGSANTHQDEVRHDQSLPTICVFRTSISTEKRGKTCDDAEPQPKWRNRKQNAHNYSRTSIPGTWLGSVMKQCRSWKESELLEAPRSWTWRGMCRNWWRPGRTSSHLATTSHGAASIAVV